MRPWITGRKRLKTGTDAFVVLVQKNIFYLVPLAFLYRIPYLHFSLYL